MVNFIVVIILHVAIYMGSLAWIRGNKVDTEYTKNIRLNRTQKIILGLFFYKEDKFEMEAIFNLIAKDILTVSFAVAALYVDLQPKVVGICYIMVFFSVIGGCLIYRFKKDDFKESKDHYE